MMLQMIFNSLLLFWAAAPASLTVMAQTAIDLNTEPDNRASNCDPGSSVIVSGSVAVIATEDGCETHCAGFNTAVAYFFIPIGTSGQCLCYSVAAFVVSTFTTSNTCGLVPSTDTEGDPHIHMWNGNKYDFHGVCDMVFVEAPDFDDGRGLAMHVRTTRQEWFSYNEAIAFKTGDLVVNIDKNGLWLHESLVTEFPLKEGALYVTRKLWNSSGHGVTYDITIGDFKKLFTIKVPPHNFLAIQVSRSGRHTSKFRNSFATSGGLIGDYNTGKAIGRDGLTEFVDMNEFGQEWQVQPNEDMLFLYSRKPQLPDAKCEMPSKESLEARRTLRSDSMKNKKAEEACADVAPAYFDDCVTDTLATGYYDLAGGY